MVYLFCVGLGCIICVGWLFCVRVGVVFARFTCVEFVLKLFVVFVCTNWMLMGLEWFDWLGVFVDFGWIRLLFGLVCLVDGLLVNFI